ncbi:hypothetical protein QR680_004766 [Steinernema hermaphroditum]|uniref:O-acyltransferase n=1 Tax=Steinernema hermaphroditum TaxID=289476 RepID=A0AA39HQX9_9BILA|nr:hypothetical protein QR680_004766 [Steinernema hermaphroditum]
MAEAAVHTDSSGSNEQNGLRRRHPSTSSQHSSVGVPSRKGSFLQKHIAIGPDQAIHKAQDSLFSSSSGYTNYRGFVNLAVLLLVVSNGRVALENLIKYGVLVSPVQWIIFLCTDPWNWPNATLVVLANISVFVVFFMEKMLEKKWIGNSFACIVYVVLLTVHMGGPVLVTLALKGNPLYSAVALSIFVVTALKLISYAHVNYWCRTDRELRRITGGGNEKKIQRPYAVSYPNNLTVSNMYYFLFAPTLCYELNYPRTPKIRKSFILRRLGEMVGLTFLIIALNQQWVVPLLKNSLAPFSEMDVGRCLERLLKLAVPNHLIWLLFFYLLFHSTLNFLAELLRFGDRQFYKDWWNSETITHFWKSWNIPVHRWALRHIYLPMVRNHYNKLTAALAVFFISALLHEYLVSVPLHMFRLWAYYGMMAQVPLGLVTDYILRGGRAGNIVVWLSLILGQPMAILIMATDSGPLAGLRAYSIVHPSAGDLIVYWLQEEEILGVTDAHEVVYEKVLRRSDRSTLLGSIALSLVEPRWTTVMRDRQLEIARLTEHDITLKYVTLQRVTLQKLDAHEAKRKLKKLLFALVHELVSAKKEEVASKNSSPAKVSKPPTVIAKV